MASQKDPFDKESVPGKRWLEPDSNSSPIRESENNQPNQSRKSGSSKTEDLAPVQEKVKPMFDFPSSLNPFSFTFISILIFALLLGIVIVGHPAEIIVRIKEQILEFRLNPSVKPSNGSDSKK